MKKTKKFSIFPLNKGLDRSSVAGSQDPRSLTKASNVVLRSRPSLKKRPGLRRIPHQGDNAGVQAAIHFFATSGGAQFSEVVRARNGRLEALRDVGGRPQFVDLGVSFSPTDTITFERYQNVLIINFENSRPLYYSIGGTPTNLSILSSHVDSPPGFSRAHDFRLFYGGRPEDAHKLWASAVNNPFDYSLNGGGFSIRIREGDGDPVGLTGISPPFRGDLYAYKWLSCHRIYRSQYGYGVDTVTDEVGAVHHNAIQATPNDVYSVATDGIHSLVMTDKYGAAEAFTITYPIYEYFQENVNWAAAKNMVMTYDKPTATILLSYVSSMASVPDRVLGYNTITKEFFEWENCEYPAIGKYFDFGRQTTFVHDAESGLSILDDKVNTLNGAPITFDVETGVLFPLGDPSGEVTFTQGWLIAKPTTKSVTVGVSYIIDDGTMVTREVDTSGGGEGAEIEGDDEDDLIGTLDDQQGIIGTMRSDMVVLPFKLEGDGHSIKFKVTQTPPASDADQSCEIYGIIYEFDYNEDTTTTVQI